MDKPMAEITWNGAAATYSIKPHGKFERGRTRTSNDAELIEYCKNVRGFSVFEPPPRKTASKDKTSDEGSGDAGDPETPESETPEPEVVTKAVKAGKGKGGPRRGR
ncbi:hypothetical protein LCGC14_0562880 [marine sediment metagenome]|uniref:Uncharacterized protein n=1 Tax=marine sediment metagenome TaxID=412755 RepID=A0A0F9S586_9ZZZZ